MRALVTGGAGFIGSHTCLTLLEKGYKITVIDSYINSNEKSLQRVVEVFKKDNKIKNIDIDIELADIRNEEVLDKLFYDIQSWINLYKLLFTLQALNQLKSLCLTLCFIGL